MMQSRITKVKREHNVFFHNNCSTPIESNHKMQKCAKYNKSTAQPHQPGRYTPAIRAFAGWSRRWRSSTSTARGLPSPPARTRWRPAWPPWRRPSGSRRWTSSSVFHIRMWTFLHSFSFNRSLQGRKSVPFLGENPEKSKNVTRLTKWNFNSHRAKTKKNTAGEDELAVKRDAELKRQDESARHGRIFHGFWVYILRKLNVFWGLSSTRKLKQNEFVQLWEITPSTTVQTVCYTRHDALGNRCNGSDHDEILKRLFSTVIAAKKAARELRKKGIQRLHKIRAKRAQAKVPDMECADIGEIRSEPVASMYFVIKSDWKPFGAQEEWKGETGNATRRGGGAEHGAHVQCFYFVLLDVKFKKNLDLLLFCFTEMNTCGPFRSLIQKYLVLFQK